MQVLGGRRLLQRVRLALPSNLPIVALKGVVLSALEERMPAPRPRPMLDVDVLVPPSALVEGVRALERIGLVVVERTNAGAALSDAETGMEIDLHTRLDLPGLFRVPDARALIAESTDAPLLDIEGIRQLEPRATYAHLTAHFARNRSTRADARRVRDFRVVATQLAPHARDIAVTLERWGLRRAAAYVLPLLAREEDPLAADIARPLNSTRGDRVAAQVAQTWLSLAAGTSSWAMPVGHLLNDHWLRGAGSAGSPAPRACGLDRLGQRELDEVGVPGPSWRHWAQVLEIVKDDIERLEHALSRASMLAI